MRVVCLTIGIIILSSAGAIAQTLPAQIQTVGMVGIAAGQTARLNVLHPELPAPLATGALCTANIGFMDDSSGQLKFAEVTVIPGRSASITLNADTEVPAGHALIRGVVTIFETGTGGGYCTMVPTLEVVDNATGKTTLVLAQTYVTPPVGIATAAGGRDGLHR